MYYKDKEKYKGEFKDDKFEGNGIFYYSTGEKYEGEWKNDKKEGKGIIELNNGKYIGEFKNGKKEGNGVKNMMVNGKMEKEMGME